MPQAVPIISLIVSAIGTTASIASSVYSTQATAHAQKKATGKAEDQANRAREAAEAAEANATQQAADTLRKRRLAQTQTILTSDEENKAKPNVLRTTMGGQ